MKRAAILIAVLGMCTWSFAQSNSKPATQSAPSGQASSGQSAGQTTTPPGKRAPQAKTKEEMDGYNAARAITDAAAQEKAADDFAAKFPDSELRVLVYKTVMVNYQQSNNGDKMVAMAKKVLAIDADDPEALVAVAQVEAEQSREADLDRDQKLADAKANAERALVTVETDVPTTGYKPEQLAAYKGYLKSQAYFVLGTIAFKQKSWADAESNLRKSIDALPQQPDEIAVYRLAVALDMQSKYADALKVVQQAVDLTKERPDSAVGKAAREEQDRLTKLNSGTAPGAKN